MLFKAIGFNLTQPAPPYTAEGAADTAASSPPPAPPQPRKVDQPNVNEASIAKPREEETPAPEQVAVAAVAAGAGAAVMLTPPQTMNVMGSEIEVGMCNRLLRLVDKG